jgi:ketosteroid isomerase-like protein
MEAAAVIERYLAAFAGPSVDVAAVDALLHSEARFLERPNRFSEAGSERDRATMLSSNERGAALFSTQRLEPIHVVVSGDVGAIRAVWTGELAEGGTPLRAYSAIFVTVKDGLVWRVESYDCFEPPPA